MTSHIGHIRRLGSIRSTCKSYFGSRAIGPRSRLPSLETYGYISSVLSLRSRASSVLHLGVGPITPYVLLASQYWNSRVRSTILLAPGTTCCSLADWYSQHQSACSFFTGLVRKSSDKRRAPLSLDEKITTLFSFEQILELLSRTTTTWHITCRHRLF